MTAFHRIFAAVAAIILLIFLTANVILLSDNCSMGRPYRVEAARLASYMESNGLENIDLSGCDYVTGIVKYGENFYDTDSDYVVREINGELYRFDYKIDNTGAKTDTILLINIFLSLMAALVLCVLLYIKYKILKPFEKLSDIPYELSKGNLTLPIQEDRTKFFGKFIWGLDMLRENLEYQKQRELNLQREKKMLLLSLSHDIKTPLSVIKLYSKALSRNLYESREKQLEIAGSILHKADEIDEYVSQIITASREGFLCFDVCMDEFYLSWLVTRVKQYYMERLSLVKIGFSVGTYTDCLLAADLERSVEVLQNVMENAIKYGDGKGIEMNFSEEENCILITIANNGCALSDADLPHIFESFWRGSNAGTEKGSGLGLYICQQLMRKMNGEIFAQKTGERIAITSVFKKA